MKQKNTSVVYEFKLGYGGIGDFIKYMQTCIIESEIKNANFYIDLNHPMKNFIIIEDKYHINKCKNENVKRKPFDYYHLCGRLHKHKCVISLEDKLSFYPLEYFKFSDECLNNCNELVNKNNIPNDYEAIHLRMGDSKMSSTNKNKHDCRVKNINFYDIINNIVSNNLQSNFIFFSDNEEIKNEIVTKYDNVHMINIKILHTSECYNKNYEENIKNNISEFVILAKAKKIHSISYSGFSIVASWIYSNQLIKYY